MYTRKDTFNSRGYAEQFKIAQNALKTIEKIKSCAQHSIQKHGDPHAERPDTQYIFYTIQQSRMICFDYVFSALENFLEHIGFILFYDWDSKEKQRHYSDKQKKLLLFNEIIEKIYQPNLNYDALETEWKNIIQSINLLDYNDTRNLTKHIHSNKHDVRMQTVPSEGAMMSGAEREQLVNDTFLSLTDNECYELVNKVEIFIKSVNSFINTNRSIFRVYNDDMERDAVEERKNLLKIFLLNPFAARIYSSQLTKSA